MDEIIKMIYSALMGALGGFARSIVGILKSIRRNEPFKIKYWSITIVISIIIGIVAGAFFQDIRLSLLAGYGGTDVLEGLYKSIRKV